MSVFLGLFCLFSWDCFVCFLGTILSGTVLSGNILSVHRLYYVPIPSSTGPKTLMFQLIKFASYESSVYYNIVFGIILFTN